MLYEDFGATQVAVFGSLAERDWFSKWSDIDIAVWGIPPEKYFRAVLETEDISRLFKFIRFDTDELDYQKTEQKAKQVNVVFDSIFRELYAFISYLEKLEDD